MDYHNDKIRYNNNEITSNTPVTIGWTPITLPPLSEIGEVDTRMICEDTTW